jgi:hypothetical protein
MVRGTDAENPPLATRSKRTRSSRASIRRSSMTPIGAPALSTTVRPRTS